MLLVVLVCLDACYCGVLFSVGLDYVASVLVVCLKLVWVCV